MDEKKYVPKKIGEESKAKVKNMNDEKRKTTFADVISEVDHWFDNYIFLKHQYTFDLY